MSFTLQPTIEVQYNIIKSWNNTAIKKKQNTSHPAGAVWAPRYKCFVSLSFQIPSFRCPSWWTAGFLGHWMPSSRLCSFVRCCSFGSASTMASGPRWVQSPPLRQKTSVTRLFSATDTLDVLVCVQGERKCLTFYLPKLAVVGLLWLSAVTLGIWQTWVITSRVTEG